MELILVPLLVCSFLYNSEASSSCAPGEFICLNGKCIDIWRVCDKSNNCGDNSDETVCVPYQCPPFIFQCVNGKCIPPYQVCYDGDHCGDNSDETTCETYKCHPAALQCLNGNCVTRWRFCSGGDQCGDNSDERYCNISSSVQCPPGWTRCPSGSRCIPSAWVCDGWDDCSFNLNSASYRLKTPGISEEASCGNNRTSTSIPAEILLSKKELKSWFLRKKRPGSVIDRWGSQVPRIAVALHLSDNSTFSPGNSTGDEIRYELTTQLLNRLRKGKRLSSQELALSVHGLLVSCLDPRDFFGDDLVRELRGRVEASGNFTNPFLVLALCNAGDDMTDRDVQRVNAAYDSQHRPFWTDSQALASMAIACISSRSSVSVDERILRDMLQELKRRQFSNGTVDNYRTTALITQALFIHDAYKKDFDQQLALKVLANGLNGSRSLLDAYYALPALNGKSLLNVTSGHCRKEPVGEEEALQKALDTSGEMMTVLYSVWMGDEINVGRTWRLRMRVNSSVYDAIETAARIDNRQKLEYNVVDGKPFVSSLNGKEDDPEMGTYWFLYLKTHDSDKDPKPVEESPVDIKLQPNQEIILWYKKAPWSSYTPMQKTAISP